MALRSSAIAPDWVSSSVVMSAAWGVSPMGVTVIVEVANPGHPYGVRGVGETSIVPPLAAIANAVSAAAGVRLTELPMSPPKVLHAIDAARG